MAEEGKTAVGMTALQLSEGFREQYLARRAVTLQSLSAHFGNVTFL